MGLRSIQFQAQIYSVGINRCVDLPRQLGMRLGTETHVPVRGTVNGEPIQSTLVSRGDGLRRLFIHSQIWRKLGVDRGDTVTISLVRDTETREPNLPADVIAGLPTGSVARREFESLTTANRRRLVQWITSVRSADSRRRRIDVAKRRLEERNRNRRKKGQARQ